MNQKIPVGRGAEKLAWALTHFNINVEGKTACDLGSNVGGFVECLLSFGAKKVYSVDTSYGTLAWKLRTDSRVVVMERANALYVKLPELVEIVTSDVGWTRQEKILPAAWNLLMPKGIVLSLLKPQYEALPSELESRKGRVKDSALERILESVKSFASGISSVCGPDLSPFVGGKGKNPEYYFVLGPK